jgi:hypothetical protein
MVRNDQKMGDKLQFAVSPQLKQAFERRAKTMGLDVPALARVAIALVAEKGIDFGEVKKDATPIR